MTIKELVAKKEELTKEKKAFVDKIDLELEAIEEAINKFVENNVKDGHFEDDDVVIVQTLRMSKKVNLLRVIKNDETKDLLIDSLENERCSGSVTAKFEKDLLGIKDFESYFDISPKETVKISVKGD